VGLPGVGPTGLGGKWDRDPGHQFVAGTDCLVIARCERGGVDGPVAVGTGEVQRRVGGQRRRRNVAARMSGREVATDSAAVTDLGVADLRCRVEERVDADRLGVQQVSVGRQGAD